MRRLFRKITLTVLSTTALSLALPALAHFDDKQIPQSYRQSWYALVGANFGPMVAMVKGEMPWDTARLQGFAHDLATLTTLDVMRGFTDGSDRGTTRAKPEIWENKADFRRKLDDLKQAAVKLRDAADSGDRAIISAQVADTGKACKACHDEYKAKNYLY